VTDYGVLFRELAVPRLVGTPNHLKAREILKRELQGRGFQVEEHAFTGRPARTLFGVPRQISGTNLIAHRPSGRPTVRPSVWLVAHYDSKGQPISMLVRLLGSLLLVLGLAGLVVDVMTAVVALGIGLALVAQNRVTDNSPGAVDNATALITILMAIDQLPRDAAVGVVFPDAEEYGLVGARALARDRAELFRDAAIINLDGIDDVGPATVFAHRPGPVGTAVARALEATHWRWLPVIVDGIALRRVGRECATILKGGVATMMIVHSPQDTVDRVRLDGAARVAAGLARVLRDR
jgi:peptidase M28-like protein